MEESKYKRKTDEEIEVRFEERAKLFGYEPGPRLERFRTVFNMLDWRKEQKLCKEDLRPLMRLVYKAVHLQNARNVLQYLFCHLLTFTCHL